LTQKLFGQVESHCKSLLSAYAEIREHKAYGLHRSLEEQVPPQVHCSLMRERVKEWAHISSLLAELVKTHPHAVAIASADYLMLCGYLTLADHWLHMEHVAYSLLQDPDIAKKGPERREFLEAKIQVPVPVPAPPSPLITSPASVDRTVCVRVSAPQDPGPKGVSLHLLRQHHEDS
jgi:hypothetical protein